MGIVFFAHPSYLGNRYHGIFDEDYRMRLSSDIRGKQIADWLGVKFNPPKISDDDTCIWVKPRNLHKVRECDWVDVSDGGWMSSLLTERPELRVIAHSEYCYDYLKKVVANEIVVIPQQHINWERQHKKVVKMIGGYIGSPSPVALRIYQEIGEALGNAGFQFITCFDYKTREDVVNFYKSIDFLVIGPWRDDSPYKTPTKMINAASFGIPSIAYPLPGYKEWEGNYVRANDVDEIVTAAKELKDWPGLVETTESYHISKIAEKYRELC